MERVPATAALFFDVDGTIVWHRPGVSIADNIANGRPSDAVVSAFLRLRERGYQTFICTGRPLRTVSGDLLALKPTGIVSSAGATVSIDGRIVHEDVIERGLLAKTVGTLLDAGATVMYEGSESCIVAAPEGERYNGFELLPTYADAETFLEKTEGMGFTKFCFEESSYERAHAVWSELEERFVLSNLGLGMYEANVRGVDKGAGVRCAIETLPYAPELTYGFGDSENDLAMLAAVDVPVAMGNAMPSVKEAAAYVTDSVEDDGVATALAHFGLI